MRKLRTVVEKGRQQKIKRKHKHKTKTNRNSKQRGNNQ